MDGDGDGGGGLTEGVGGVESVGGGGGGGDCGGGGTSGADLWGDDDVGGAGDLPGQSDACARGDGSGRSREVGDGRVWAGGDVGAGVERGDLEDLEIGGGYGPEIVQVGVVPARVRGAGDVHRRAVVGEDETVFFHGVENHLIGRRERGDVETGFEAKARAHGRSGDAAGGGSPVGGWRREAGAGILQRE